MNKIREAIAQRQGAERRERRERILNAARQVFFKKGYIGATMRDIALEAAFSPGLIYHYFKNKDDIYASICEEAFQVMLALLRKAALTEGDIPARLTAVAEAYLAFYTDYPQYFEIISFKELGFKKVGLSKESVKRLDALSLESLSIPYSLVCQGMADKRLSASADPWEMTFALWASIEGLIFIHKRGYLETYALTLKQVFSRQLALLVEGIGVR